MPMHADAYPASRKVGQAILRAGEAGYITNTNVADATTAAGLKTVITNVSGHADQQPLKARLNSMIDIGIADATLNDTDLQAQTTYRGLAGLTQADLTRTAGGPVGD